MDNFIIDVFGEAYFNGRVAVAIYFSRLRHDFYQIKSVDESLVKE
jgi:predicted Zn-dependent protease